MSIMRGQPILMIEDSPEDYEITCRAFKKSRFNNPIYHLDNGDDALDYLHKRGAYSDPEKAPRPGIVLLDLNIPGTNGKEVLRDIKSTHELKNIPIIVFTTSDDKQDIEKCYELGANSYLQKPVNLKRFIESIVRLKEYWFEIVILPER